MRYALALLPLLASTVSAGWFSDSKPDKDVQAPIFDGAKPDPPKQPAKSIFDYIPQFDVETLLTYGPVAKLISKTGVNVTEKFAEAKRAAAATGWHPDIPLITDDNYQEMIMDEKLSAAEMDKRVWIILVSVPNGDELAKITDQKFDATYNLTHSARDKALPHVRWGRINYLDVTHLTTKWGVWKAPYLIVARSQGRELRFYNPKQVRFVPEVMHRFLKDDGWKETKPWSGAFAPGGSLEKPLDMFASFWTQAYIILLRIPKWLMLLITGGVGSILVNFLHSGPAPAAGARGNKRARIASNAKKEDGGSPVKPISRQASPEKEDRGRRRSQSPSKRASARIAARSESPSK
ncbi:hypothetical protein FRB96_000051 [Tulasnella sp. 330]|nr:hypothetical protein FRB96_000051 [Tulasnella sp. 330]KAG8884055.1 hypothetical protein FRB97_005277 [Tulasnella sp. 331]KAG8890519.1 hypothetical protein FRB98_007866 [Tulasnella sp. 332]